MSDERRRYLLLARQPWHRRKVACALVAVRRAVTQVSGTWACALSGGKDSTAMLSVCREAGWRGPVFFFAFRETPGKNIALVERLAAWAEAPLIRCEVPGAWDVYDRCGGFFVDAETAEQRRAVRDMLAGYKRGAAEAARAAGLGGLFIGLRAAESRERSITLSRKRARHGAVYQTTDRDTATCCPIADWSGADVWARLISQDLPWLPVYDRADNRERERSELTWLAAPGLWRWGMLQRLRERDPAAFIDLIRRFPEARRYG